MAKSTLTASKPSTDDGVPSLRTPAALCQARSSLNREPRLATKVDSRTNDQQLSSGQSVMLSEGTKSNLEVSIAVNDGRTT